MECDGTGDNDNGKCQEECTCHHDDDASNKRYGNGTDIKQMKQRKGKTRKFFHPQIGQREMEKMKHLFTTWLKEYRKSQKAKPGKHIVSHIEPLKDTRVSFITKMLKNYQYFREKQRALRLLQEQQDELGKQQKHLEKLLTKQEFVLPSENGANDHPFKPNSAKSRPPHPHADDINITITAPNTSGQEPLKQTTASNVNTSQINQLTSFEVLAIKAEIAEIRKQQEFLSKQQSLLAIELAKEKSFFSGMQQLIQLILKQNQNAVDTTQSSSTPNPFLKQPFSQDVVNSDETPLKMAETTNANSGMLGKLQAELSRLVFRGDGATEENDGDNQPIMLLKSNEQDDQISANVNPLLQKNANISPEPSSNMLRDTGEVDNAGFDDQGLRNFFLGRTLIDDAGMEGGNDLAFDKDGDEDEPGPGILVMEKKTLHPYDMRPNSYKTKNILRKDTVQNRINSTNSRTHSSTV